MITPFDIYLVGLVQDLAVFFGVIFVLCIIAAVILGCLTLINNDGYGHRDNRDAANKKFKYFAKIIAIVFSVSLLITTILPSSNVVIAMYIVPKIINSPATANYESLYASLPLDIQQLLQKKLKSELENN